MKKNKMSLTTELDLTPGGDGGDDEVVHPHRAAPELRRWRGAAEQDPDPGGKAGAGESGCGHDSKRAGDALDGQEPRFAAQLDAGGRGSGFPGAGAAQPRTRREEQLRMAGDVAASMVWTLCAEACIEELGFGAGRLNRLKEEALANYRQVNEEGHADGLDVAMEHLRRCAQAALKEDIMVENQPDEDRARQSERDYEEQKRAFLKRAVMQELGRRAGKGSLRVLSEKKLEEKATAAMAQLKESTWAKRISTP